MSRVILAGRQQSARIKTKRRFPSTRQSWSCKGQVWEDATKRGWHLVQICSRYVPVDVPQEVCWHPEYLYYGMEQSRDPQGRRGRDSKSTCHSIAQVSAASSGVSAGLSRCVRINLCDVSMPVHVPGVQLSSCTGVWKLCCHFILSLWTI